MIIKVEVDLSQLYAEFDEDHGGTLLDQVQDNIISNVKQAIWSSIRQECLNTVTKITQEAIAEQKDAVIGEMIHNIIHNQAIKKPYSGGEMVSFADYIKDELSRTYLQDSQVRKNLDDIVKQTSHSLATELKQRYDILFASQIVTRLNAQGMLKEEVAKILLGDANSTADK